MDHKNDHNGAQRRESRLTREQNANRFTPFSPPSSTGQHGTVTSTTGFTNDSFSDFNPDKGGVVRSRTPDNIRAYNARVSAAATRKDSRPAAPVNTSFIERAFPEWNQPGETFDIADKTDRTATTSMNEAFSSIHVTKKKPVEASMNEAVTSLHVPKKRLVEAKPPQASQPSRIASGPSVFKGESFSSIHLSKIRRGDGSRPSHPSLIERPSAPEPRDRDWSEEAQYAAIPTAFGDKENIPPPSEDSVPVEHLLGKERRLSLSRAEMQPRVETISNSSEGTINGTLQDTMLHHNVKPSGQRRPSGRAPSPSFGRTGAQPAVSTLQPAQPTFTDAGAGLSAQAALTDLQRIRNKIGYYTRHPSQTPAALLPATSVKESPVKASSSKQSPTEVAKGSGSNAFIYSTFRHLSDLTSGSLKFSTMRDGVPVFVKHGKARTKFGPSENEHDTVAGVDVPEDDKDIFVSMDNIREEVRQLQDHDEMVQREADELRAEVQRLHNQLKQSKQRKVSVSDSAFGSGSESDFSINRALEHQRQLYDEKIMQLQTRLDQASRKVGVHDIHSAALTAERDEALQRASVAKEVAANLKTELEETQKKVTHASCYRQEIENFQKQVKTLRRTIDELRDEKQAISTDYRTLKSDKTQQDHDYQDLLDQLKGAREDLKSLRYDYDSVQDELKALAVDHASLEQRNQSYFDENKRLQSKIEANNTRIAELEKLAKDHADLEQSNQFYVASNNLLRSKVEASNTRIAELEKCVADRDQVIDHMKTNQTTQIVPVDQYVALGDKVKILAQRQVSSHNDMIAEIEKVVQSSTSSVLSLQEKMNSMAQIKDTKIKELETKIDQFKTTIAQLKTTVGQLKTKNDQLEADIMAKDQKIVDLEEELETVDQLNTRNNQLEADTRAKDEKIVHLEELLKFDNRTKDNKIDHLRKLGAENNASIQALYDKQAELTKENDLQRLKINEQQDHQQEMERVLWTKDQKIRSLISEQKNVDNHIQSKDEKIRQLTAEISEIQQELPFTQLEQRELAEQLKKYRQEFNKWSDEQKKSAGDTLQSLAWVEGIDWTDPALSDPPTAPVTEHRRHHSEGFITQNSKQPVSILKKTTQFTREDTMTGRLSVRSGPSARFDDTVQSGMSTTSIERNMTSAYILPDITLGKENVSPSTQSKGKQPAEILPTPADQHRTNDTRSIPQGMCIHKTSTCTVCTRIANNGKTKQSTLPQRSPTKPKSTTGGYLARVQKPQPVSDRRPSQHLDEPTIRPSVPPGLALAVVLDELKRELKTLELQLNMAMHDYFKLDKSIGKSVQDAALSRLKDRQRSYEAKSGQIYKLHDVLEGQKAAGQEMTQDFVDATIASICVPNGDVAMLSD